MSIHHYTMNHKQLLIEAQLCICTYCLYEYNINKIKDWCDNGNTAVCPYCWVDSVLPSPNACDLYTVEQVIIDHLVGFKFAMIMEIKKLYLQIKKHIVSLYFNYYFF